MAIGYIIFLILISAIFIILRIYFKKAFRIVSIISLILFAITIIFSLILYMEAKDMKENFPNSNNTFLLDLDGDIVAGFKIYNGLEPVYVENVENFNLYYRHQDFEPMKEDSYLMLIFKKEVFAEDGEIELGLFTFTYEEAFDILKSTTPMNVFADKVLDTEKHATLGMIVEQLTKNFESDDNLKGLIFAAIFSDNIEEAGALGIIDGIQKDYITVYPGKLLFKMIKVIPKSMVKNVVSGMEIKDGE